MKISQKSKRVVAPPEPVLELITKLVNTPDDQLATIIAEDIPVWKWARSDLNAWIKVLNKFDAILEKIIRDYHVDTLQSRDFSNEDKNALLEILRFERLLLENSTNRKIFSSYDRIHQLLFSEDLDVVIFTLKLLLRPALQYSAQPSVSQALHISTPRLQSLAKRWPHLREYGIDLYQLCTASASADIDALPVEAREVNFTFYRTNSTSTDEEHKAETSVAASSSIESPRKSTAAPAPTPSGAVVVHLDEQALSSHSPMQTLRTAVETHSIPESEHFELLCRIRTALALKKGHQVDREKLVVIRLLAVAVFGHTHTEAQATTSLFIYEPDLIAHISELLQIDKGISDEVQTVAVSALDALSRYRGKVQEILTSINAGVNHGLLMSLLRKMVTQVALEESQVSHSFVEALFSFVTFISSHTSGGSMVVGAGIIPLLIQVLDNKLPHRLPVVSKSMQLVDNVMYSFTNSFQLFCAARGVEALVDRVAYEVDFNISEHGDPEKSRQVLGNHGALPVARMGVMKHLLRSLHRMMQTSGTSEGLRGLIDTSVLSSVKKILDYRGLFGAGVLPMAINIMSTFVHNEPTSLTVIQDAGLPEVFYRTIEVGLEASIELIQTIPNAIGALCLNDVGMAQLAARPSIIPAVFSIFTSERHLKVLLDKENAVLMGTAIDELIRHHPLLKPPVFESISATLSKIEDLGNSYMPPKDVQQWYRLVPTPAEVPKESGTDVTMEDVQEGVPAPPGDGAIIGAEQEPEDDTAKAHDNHIVTFIDVIGRFLEGLFQHAPHCREFLSTSDGVARLGRLSALPCLPFDFANSVASDSMVQVLRTMTDVATGETLAHLGKIVNESLASTKDLWENAESLSKLAPLVEFSDKDERQANERFRNLVTLHIRITLLSDVFATAGYSHGRQAIALLQTFMDSTTPDSLRNLGSLHRSTIWENLALNSALAELGIDIGKTPGSSPLDGTPDQADISLPGGDGSNTAAPNGTVEAQQPEPVVPGAQPETPPKEQASREHNAIALKHITHGLPNALTPFFQAMVKMFYMRRTPDATTKKQIADSSALLAEIINKHLTVEPCTNKSPAYLYYSVILSLVMALVVDERTSSTPLQTVQLLAMYKTGCLDAIFSVSRKFMDSIDTIVKVKEESRTENQVQELLHAYSGLKVALHLLHPMISHKPLLDSGQTASMTTRDKKDTDPDYFEPHNFLVRLRLAALPFLRDLWEAPWLIQAPLNVSRPVVQTVLELVNGDNEEGKDSEGSAPSIIPAPRSTGTDESRIRQLTDMGFPRSAAERALTRTHNNVSAATELLLAHPYPFPPDPEPAPAEAAPEAPAVASGNTEDAAHGDAAENGETGDVNAETSTLPVASEADEDSSKSSETPPSAALGKTPKEWRDELNEARESLRAGLSRQSLLLVDEHLSLIFDLHVAFIRPLGPHQQRAVQDLVEDITAFSPFAHDVQEQPLANRCRLLALVLRENPTSLTAELRGTLMSNLLALLLSNDVSIQPEDPIIPRWLASHLLVTEALLTLAEDPRSVSVPKEGEEAPIEPVHSGPVLTEARTIVFEFCMRLLVVQNLPADEFLATLRLVVFLTRNQEVAAQFVKRDGVALLFSRLRSSPVNGSSSYVAIILRHVVEDSGTINAIMRQAIKKYLSQPRSRSVDAANYVRNCSSMALRDTEAFISATTALCQLTNPHSSSPIISLKDAAAPESSQAAPIPEMQVDGSEQAKPNSALELLVHFLIAELMRSTRAINGALHSSDTSTREISHAPAANAEDPVQRASDSDAPGQSKELSQYVCFLMQCLTELLFSYDACKAAVLSFTVKKKTQTPSKEGKYKSTTLNFLLSEIIAYNSITSQPSSANRDQITRCNWAMSLVVALCMDSSTSHDPKDIPADLLAVRKFVLEAINRAIRDSTASDRLESRYGRLLALVELCHRLLTVRVNPTRKNLDDAPTHIAKLMLDKGFVTTLTTALSDMDLNYPNVRSLVAAILRPLELLSKIAIKMSKSVKSRDSAEGGDKYESEPSVDSEEEDEEVREGREETPDLYRNSALGIYGGEMEDRNYVDEDEEMDDVGDETDEDQEMDFAEQTGSEDTSETGDEEEDDLEDEPDAGNAGWDEDVEDEDADMMQQARDNEEDGDGDADEAEEDDEDGEDDERMMWEDINDIHGHRDPEAAGDEADEDEEGAAPIHIIHEAEDEPSEDEDYAHDETEVPNGGDLVGDMFGFSAHLRDPTALFLPGRRGGDGTNVFARARNGPPSAPESTTHPLLLDVAHAARSSGQARSRQPRIISNAPTELLQTIEDMVNNGAVQLFQHIMTRRGGVTEAIRVDVPPSAIMNFDRGLRRGGMVQALRVERNPRPQPTQPTGQDLDPLSTLQRWAEEVKIVHGDFVNERAAKLANHIVLALLPAAIESARLAKIQEEKRQREERENAERAEQEAAEREAAEKVAAEKLAAETAEKEAAMKEAVPTDMPTPDKVADETSQNEAESMDAEPARATAFPSDTPTVPQSEEQPMDVSTTTVPPAAPSSGPDAEMGDATADSNNATEEPQPEPGPSGTTDPPARVTVMIQGSLIDITDTGIDPTFLEALPDDMREEVLSQHVRDQRAARVERPADSQISNEFLDALPPELRAEIIQQEALERTRRRPDDTAQVPAQGAAEIDPASFIASLDPTLRQAVLLEQDDGFIQTLPSDMIAEVGIYREGVQRRYHRVQQPQQRVASGSTPTKKAVPHDAMQLLDRPGVASLIRLLFFPQVLKKTLLFRVLGNVCENTKTRVDLFNLLLGILQDGSGDLAAVDKSFSQMSVKGTKSQRSPVKPRSVDYLSLALPSSHEAMPDLIAQRCLEALTFIVSANQPSTMFFLTEHEVPAGLKRSASRKGKGKEKQQQQTHYPIVLLLGLLDRHSLLRTPSIMESIANLLSIVTRPLIVIKGDAKPEAEVIQQPADVTMAPASSSTAELAAESTHNPPTSGGQGTSEAPAPPAVSIAPPEAPKEPTATSEPTEQDILQTSPPRIPERALRLIVNILTVGECSARTFQHTLALIQHLSHLLNARDIIAQELRAKAQEFGHSLYADLDELAVALQGTDTDIMMGSLATKFSSSSSVQTKFLRVLKTIDYMYSSKQSSSDEEDAEKVQAIYESFRFSSLWTRLGDGLALIEDKPDKENVATVLLPLIEALMVVCKYVGPKSAPNALRTLRATSSPRSPTTPRESMEDLFVTFTDAHRKILNLMVRNNPSLMSGSFSLLVHNPRVLDFDNKRNYFTQQLHKRSHRDHHSTLQLNLRRQRVFEDSFQQLQWKSGDQIKYGKLSIRFFDEEGVDAGGLTREWFQILARQMFDPNNALFQPCAADKLTYQPNKNSWVNPEHLSFFKFVGRVIGKAIYDGRLLDAYFARSLYRQLLGKPVDYRDVEWVDPEYYNSLCWILENDPTPLELTFSVEADEFGVNRNIALKEGGDNIAVTDENKKEFVQLSAQYRLYSSIKDQIEHLSSGFYEIIPKDLITIFNEQELELLISGTPDIDVDEWRSATEYNGYTSSDPNIVWWWRALKSFTRDEKAKVLSFATGTSRVPLGGFVELQGVQGNQRFSIHKAYGESDRLPQAHTCFNQIDLPQYTSYEMLRQQLLLAINEGGEGFGFV